MTMDRATGTSSDSFTPQGASGSAPSRRVGGGGGANSLGPTGSPPDVGHPALRRYLGEWNQLISTTNWEKGRIICQWRAELVASAAAPRDYADETWAKHVGQVSAQHVGRLRRTYERFGTLYRKYRGLYWSHFHAAVDWSDAEDWLERAQSNRWSVSQMRAAHWEALGKPADQEPKAEDIVTSDFDEDAAEGDPGGREWDPGSGQASPHSEGDQTDGSALEEAPFDVEESAGSSEPGSERLSGEVARVRPFEEVAELPADLNEGFEQFKLAILRHRVSGWKEVTAQAVLGAIDALRQLVLAPPDSQS